MRSRKLVLLLVNLSLVASSTAFCDWSSDFLYNQCEYKYGLDTMRFLAEKNFEPELQKLTQEAAEIEFLVNKGSAPIRAEIDALADALWKELKDNPNIAKILAEYKKAMQIDYSKIAKADSPTAQYEAELKIKYGATDKYRALFNKEIQEAIAKIPNPPKLTSKVGGTIVYKTANGEFDFRGRTYRQVHGFVFALNGTMEGPVVSVHSPTVDWDDPKIREKLSALSDREFRRVFFLAEKYRNRISREFGTRAYTVITVRTDLPPEPAKPQRFNSPIHTLLRTNYALDGEGLSKRYCQHIARKLDVTPASPSINSSDARKVAPRFYKVDADSLGSTKSDYSLSAP